MSDDDRKVFKLSRPFEWDGDMITELRLREPKVKDLKNLPDNKIEQNIRLLCKMSGLPRPVIDQLSMYDFNSAQVVLQSFLGGGPQSGPDSAD